MPTIEQAKLTPDLTFLETSEQDSNFTDPEVENLKQQTAEYNFIQEARQIPKKDYLQEFEQVNQFVSNPIIAQQGGKLTENEIAFLSEIAVKDNQGYWNPNNEGKVVEINSSRITMKNVNQPLWGISKQTKERKLMLPNQDYYFKNTKQVLELPVNK